MFDKVKKVLNRRVQVVEDYQEVFNGPVGERVLAHLCKTCHMFEPTFVRGDPYESALREGERRVVLSIFKALKVDVSKLQQMSEDQDA